MLFVAFIIFMGFHLQQVGPLHILAYLEFLSSNHLSMANIANHISAIKAIFTLYNLDASCYYDKGLKYYNRAMLLNKPFKAIIKKIIDRAIIKNYRHSHPLTNSVTM